MVAVPAPTPVTTPLASTLAMLLLLLDHVPPPVVLLNVVVLPGHTVLPPLIAAGLASIVATLVVRQPDTVYVILAVPADTPLNTPAGDVTDATDVEPLDHVPPDGLLLSVLVVPAHSSSVPLIVLGTALIVIVFVL